MGGGGTIAIPIPLTKLSLFLRGAKDTDGRKDIHMNLKCNNDYNRKQIIRVSENSEY